MNAVFDWGIDLIRAIQSIQNPALTAAMKAVTSLGSEYAYLAMVPLVYWCVDERKGLRLGVMVLVSAWSNCVFKEVWKQPRPYDFDPKLGLAKEPTFGFPSGHSQNSAAFWGVVAPWLRRPFGLIAAFAFPLVVGFSRVYLGVHFPTDVFGGWAIGALLLVLYYVFGPLIEAFLAASRRQIKLVVLAAVVFIMNEGYRQDVGIGGVFLGMGVGYILMTERFPFSASRAADGSKPSFSVLAARFALGITGALALYFGLKLAFPGDGSAMRSLFRFIRYGAIGFWVAAGAPWLFLRLTLAGAR